MKKRISGIITMALISAMCFSTTAFAKGGLLISPNPMAQKAEENVMTIMNNKNSRYAVFNGVVTSVGVTKGVAVQSGDALCTIK